MSVTHVSNMPMRSDAPRLVDRSRDSKLIKIAVSTNKVGHAQQRKFTFISSDCTTTSLLIKNRPGAEAYVRKAVRALKKRNTRKAAAFFRKAIAADSSYAVAHAGLGNALFMLGKKRDALACYNSAIAEDPTKHKYYNNRGVIRTKLKQFGKAMKDLLYAIKLNPKDAAAFFNLGWLYLVQKKYAKAIACLKGAEMRGLKSAELYLKRGEALQGLGKYKQAFANYGKALNLAPNSKEIMKRCQDMADILIKMQKKFRRRNPR